ncbi:uncharacterized protein LOC125039731 [Penaeus chinensis]|uniref:uncharacterized protein LOC125039731 n=1 Tax=Penaeus chinensis TaxID=139456 RepID=UPI001FB83D5F|nr:uncharacterized protein LOC125039731 [Penaeus chinensis]
MPLVPRGPRRPPAPRGPLSTCTTRLISESRAVELRGLPEELPAEDMPEELSARDASEEQLVGAGCTPERPASLGNTPKDLVGTGLPEELPAVDAPEVLPAEDTPEELPAEDTPEELPASKSKLMSVRQAGGKALSTIHDDMDQEDKHTPPASKSASPEKEPPEQPAPDEQPQGGAVCNIGTSIEVLPSSPPDQMMVNALGSLDNSVLVDCNVAENLGAKGGEGSVEEGASDISLEYGDVSPPQPRKKKKRKRLGRGRRVEDFWKRRGQFHHFRK